MFGLDKKAMRRTKGAGNITIISRESELISAPLLAVAFVISFCLPNLVFSGRSFFDTLHIMKWTVTMVPIGVLTVILGVKLALNGKRDGCISIDPFCAVLLIILAFITLQPLMTEIKSMSTFVKEWFFYATLVATYLIAYNLFKSKKTFRAILLGAAVNAAINVVFAELLIRGLNTGIPFILDVPGNYIGNTAQQEMFGLWMAMAVLNGIFLHIDFADSLNEGEHIYTKPLALFNLFILLVNAWGLWNSTARGGILSLFVAFAVLVLCLWRGAKRKALRASFIIFGAVVMLVVGVIIASSVLGTDRGGALISKFSDMVNNPTSIAARESIWRTSLEVIKMEPAVGVGLGQYKWHFLDAQRIMYAEHPEFYERPGFNWQFTYWAHSEYIQWFAETGIIGGAMLMLLGAAWIVFFIRALIRKAPLSAMAMWGISMSFLLWFDALFSRPFHRIENSVWMSLAFALANVEIFPRAIGAIWSKLNKDMLLRAFGALIAAISLYGLYFLGGGLYGDQLIHRAMTKPGTIVDKNELLLTAKKFLMAEDDADEQYANFLISLGKSQKDDQITDLGISNLKRVFDKAPTSKMLFELLNLAQERGDQDMLRELAKFLSPSMYTIQQK